MSPTEFAKTYPAKWAIRKYTLGLPIGALVLTVYPDTDTPETIGKQIGAMVVRSSRGDSGAAKDAPSWCIGYVLTEIEAHQQRIESDESLLRRRLP